MPSPPQTVEEVLHLFEQGQLTPAEAFAQFRRLEGKPTNGTTIRRTVEPRQRELDEESERKRRLADVLSELDGLIGLTEVKGLVREIQAFVEIQQRRKAELLVAEPLVMHMIFKGNPLTTRVTY